MKDIIFVNSHPIQYFAPMYKYFNEHNIPTTAWYCSDFSVKGGIDVEFGQKITWDIYGNPVVIYDEDNNVIEESDELLDKLK